MTLVLQAIIAVAPLIVDLVRYVMKAQQAGWIKSGEDLRAKIQVTTENDKRMDLAEYLSKHSPK